MTAHTTDPVATAVAIVTATYHDDLDTATELIADLPPSHREDVLVCLAGLASGLAGRLIARGEDVDAVMQEVALRFAGVGG